MNSRERFLRTMRLEPVDHVPFFVSGGWQATTERWVSEGMPRGTDLCDHFGGDRQLYLPVHYGFAPKFEDLVIEETDEYVVYVNHEGITMREIRGHAETSMPQFIEFPIKTRDDFRRHLDRLRLNFADRVPQNWVERCAGWRDRTDPLLLFADRYGGFFGPLRNLFGLERLCTLFYDDPMFLEEVLDNRAQLMIEITERVLEDTDIDYFAFWEDMAYKTGPLLSPALFKKYLSPRYKRVTEFLRSRGIDLIFVDSDGNVEELIPLWLDAGVNGVWPFEVAAGMDVVRLRKQYGSDLLMIGGLDKRALAQGREAIKNEVESKVPWMIEQGGYIPQVDHGVPPDVSWDSFCYFNEVLRSTLGIG